MLTALFGKMYKSPRRIFSPFGKKCSIIYRTVVGTRNKKSLKIEASIANGRNAARVRSQIEFTVMQMRVKLKSPIRSDTISMKIKYDYSSKINPFKVAEQVWKVQSVTDPTGDKGPTKWWITARQGCPLNRNFQIGRTGI